MLPKPLLSLLPPPYHYHPMVVHFPIALLLTGLAAQVARFFLKRQEEWLRPASAALLWLGTASAWAAVAMGEIAEKTAPHVPAAWEVLSDHSNLAYWTAWIFTGLSMWRLFGKERGRALLAAAWAIGAGFLLATAYHGGLLAYTYGMGVKPQ